MGLAPTRRPARLVSTRELGEMMGCSTEVARDRVARAYAARPGKWLIHGNGHRGNRHFRINLSMFRAAHPEYFEAPAIDDVEEKLDATRAEIAELRTKVRALGAANRELSKRVTALEGATTDEDRVEPFAIGATESPDWARK
jgi:hypothetical protein